MQHLFWVVENKLAGRPGPDRKPWSLAQLRAAGFGAVLSVNDGLLCHPQDFEQRQMAYACVPLSPNAPPCSGDLDRCISALPHAYTFVAEHLTRGHRVLVHCSSGKDRTGLFFSYFLMRHFGQSVSEAI
ncbi:MAG: dual specificity protein phosphatase family protein, partial [Luteimonas sp.]